MTGRRSALAAAVLAALTVLTATPVSAGLVERAGNTFALMADQFISAFQPIEGLVVQVDGSTVYLDLGSSRAQVGQELTIFRKGGPFAHPLTGKPLGHYEDVLGYAQITRVEPRFSQAVFIALPDKPPPGPDDGARITRGRIRVAITPVLDLSASKVDLRRVPYVIATILERSKRFLVVDPLTVSDMLANGSMSTEEVLARPERARATAKNLEVSGWLVPIILERRGVTYLDVTWISAVTGRALFSHRQPLVPGGTAEEQRFPWEPRAED